MSQRLPVPVRFRVKRRLFTVTHDVTGTTTSELFTPPSHIKVRYWVKPVMYISVHISHDIKKILHPVISLHFETSHKPPLVQYKQSLLIHTIGQERLRLDVSTEEKTVLFKISIDFARFKESRLKLLVACIYSGGLASRDDNGRLLSMVTTISFCQSVRFKIFLVSSLNSLVLKINLLKQ